MERRLTGVFIVAVILVLAFGAIGLAAVMGRLPLKQGKKGTTPTKTSLEVTPTPELSSKCTRYTNEEYGFSLCYPLEWAIPVEGWIEPPHQHLHQVVLDPLGEGYLVDIYNQPTPVSLGSFVRDYFKDIEAGVSWTDDVEINGQEALQFFLPKMGVKPMGTGAVAFRKKSYVLTISTPVKEAPEGDPKKLVNEAILTRLVESFEWIED